jgi:hypothetical protein
VNKKLSRHYTLHFRRRTQGGSRFHVSPLKLPAASRKKSSILGNEGKNSSQKGKNLCRKKRKGRKKALDSLCFLRFAANRF